MTINRAEFNQLMSSLGHLAERRKQIDELRQAYFAAVKVGDSAAQQQLFQEAERAGLELFEELPLAQIAELEAAQQLGERLGGVTPLRELARESAKLVTELQELDAESRHAYENRNLLMELRDDLRKLYRQLNGSAGMSMQQPGEIPSVAQIRNMVQQTLETVQQDRHELERQTTTLRAELAEAQALSALVALELMSPRDYDSLAERQIKIANSSLQAISDFSKKEGLIQKIQEAENDIHIWQDLKRSLPLLANELQAVEQRLHYGEALNSSDYELFDRINIYQHKRLPSVITRLAARKERLQPQRVAPSKSSSSLSEEVCATITKWWSGWYEIGNRPIEAPINKQQFLEELNRQILQLFAQEPVLHADPVMQEISITWKRRCHEALELVRFLLGVERYLAHYGLVQELEIEALIDRMDFLDNTVAPEAYWLLAKEWEAFHARLYDQPSALSSASQLPAWQGDAHRKEAMRGSLAYRTQPSDSQQANDPVYLETRKPPLSYQENQERLAAKKRNGEEIVKMFLSKIENNLPPTDRLPNRAVGDDRNKRGNQSHW